MNALDGNVEELREDTFVAKNYLVGMIPVPKRANGLFIAASQPSRCISRPIVNDSNAWIADHPAEFVSHLCRLVHVSVETVHIVDALPLALQD